MSQYTWLSENVTMSQCQTKRDKKRIHTSLTHADGIKSSYPVSFLPTARHYQFTMRFNLSIVLVLGNNLIPPQIALAYLIGCYFSTSVLFIQPRNSAVPHPMLSEQQHRQLCRPVQPSIPRVDPKDWGCFANIAGHKDAQCELVSSAPLRWNPKGGRNQWDAACDSLSQ